MPDISLPRGVRDLMPNEALRRNEVIESIERVYRSFGFLPIYTPMVESLKVLKAKDAIGEESKLIFEIKGQDAGLRYDHTMGLARYISMHNSMPMPFKRYAIGQSWRMDEPQRLRYREFSQADVDILGGDPYKSNAEVIGAVGKAMDALGLDYTIKINSRRIIDGFLKSISLESHVQQVMRAIDKIDKIGADGVAGELEALKLKSDDVKSIIDFISFKGSNAEKLQYLEKMVKDSGASEEISKTLELVQDYGIHGSVAIDFSVVRGLDYYTGMVLETFDNTGSGGKTSICSGGRYDNLVSMFSESKLPGVGASIGIDRVLDVLGFSTSKKRTYSKVFVAYIKEKNYTYALKVANALRDSGLNVDLNQASRNISNQLSYASSLGIPYSIIVGDSEEKDGKVKLRNMETGDERLLSVEDAKTELMK